MPWTSADCTLAGAALKSAIHRAHSEVHRRVARRQRSGIQAGFGDGADGEALDLLRGEDAKLHRLDELALGNVGHA